MSRLYEVTYSQVYHTVRAIIRDEGDALDILQNTYIKVFTHLESFREGWRFMPWIRRIASNTARDFLKKRRPTLFTELDAGDKNDEPVEERIEDRDVSVIPNMAMDEAETKRLLGQILSELPDDQRLVVALYYYENLPVAEIARSLGLSEGTVKSKLHRARRKIEERVRVLEEGGTKLYGLAPLPFLLFLLRGLGSCRETPAPGVLQNVLSASAAAAAPRAAERDGRSGNRHGCRDRRRRRNRRRRNRRGRWSGRRR